VLDSGLREVAAGSVSAWLGSEWCGSCDGLFFDGGVGVFVDVGRSGAFVLPEPERDVVMSTWFALRSIAFV
jgi:hypothetical protein